MTNVNPLEWLIRIDDEDINEAIVELKEEIEHLESGIQEYDGDLSLYLSFIKDSQKEIQYKQICINILNERKAMTKLYKGGK